jgi:hypothetical protein
VLAPALKYSRHIPTVWVPANSFRLIGSKVELFFVLQGELSFLTPTGWVAAPAGAAIFAPKGIPPALPSGFEEFYARCGEVLSEGGPPNRQRLVSIAAEYGYQFLPRS